MEKGRARVAKIKHHLSRENKAKENEILIYHDMLGYRYYKQKQTHEKCYRLRQTYADERCLN